MDGFDIGQENFARNRRRVIRFQHILMNDLSGAREVLGKPQLEIRITAKTDIARKPQDSGIADVACLRHLRHGLMDDLIGRMEDVHRDAQFRFVQSR